MSEKAEENPPPNAASLLADMTLADTTDVRLQELSKFDDETMNSIATVAIAKYGEGKYADCQSLFALLSILSSGYAEYWLRLGLAAQKNANFDLAARSYGAASELDPDLIEPRLFAECQPALKEVDKAKNEILNSREAFEGVKIGQLAEPEGEANA